MATWPATLPQVLQVSGFEETLGAFTIRTQMDAGPAKQRRRFTAAPRPVTGSITVDADGWDDFVEFYETTLEGGSLSFDWVKPGTATPATFRFTAPPSRTAFGGDIYIVSMQLEILP